MNVTFKKLTLLLLISCSLATVNAQIQFGVKGGLNLANLSVSGDNSGLSYGFKPDFHVGALVSIPAFSSFSIQPEVLYSGQGSKISANGDHGTYNFAYLNIPVLLKYNTSSGFFAETGPQFSLLLSANTKADGMTTDVKSDLNSSDFGWVFGVGYLLPVNLGFDARYDIGLSNQIKNSGSGGGSIKNGVIQIGVFYLFGQGPKK